MIPNNDIAHLVSPLNVQRYAATSSIGKFPLNIVKRIFTLGTHDSDDFSDRISFPLLVSHVCRTWRAIAFVLPALWSTITMRDSSGEYRWDQELLSRSHQHPLTIYLDFRDPRWDFSDEDSHHLKAVQVSRILDILLPHAYRFKEFTLLVETWAPIYHTLLRFPKHIMPLLESVDIQRCNMYHAFTPTFQPYDLGFPLPLVCDAPNLRHLNLSGTHLLWSSWNFRNLRTLSLTYLSGSVRPTMGELAQIVLMSQNTLEELEVQAALPAIGGFFGADGSSNYTVMEPIVLPKLRTLKLGYIDPEEVTPLIDILATPALQELSLIGVYDQQSPNARMLELALENSKYSLRRSDLPPGQWDSELANMTKQASENEKPSRRGAWKNRPMTARPVVDTMMVDPASLDLRSVKHLSLSSFTYSAFQSFRLADFFLCFKSLSRLTFDDPDLNVLRTLLSPLPGSLGKPLSQVYLCATVQEFTFMHVDPRIIVEWLEQRERMGMPSLAKLNIHFSSLRLNDDLFARDGSVPGYVDLSFGEVDRDKLADVLDRFAEEVEFIEDDDLFVDGDEDCDIDDPMEEF
ncbi:hypothetical protein JAAARDRAFT_40708 [Jaapia argillacea MUCL 33604]|uniref:F-box domain-containing protein n=1 Tax=Jaapia argillacea MUCL 33604 TaxID=933084 RepID=A0A067PAD4_9AGAM|nr:hypothetical protein JAAARDRAFT_40708 [Jaapia argillacea MUCL 33604]